MCKYKVPLSILGLDMNPIKKAKLRTTEIIHNYCEKKLLPICYGVAMHHGLDLSYDDFLTAVYVELNPPQEDAA